MYVSCWERHRHRHYSTKYIRKIFPECIRKYEHVHIIFCKHFCSDILQMHVVIYVDHWQKGLFLWIFQVLKNRFHCIKLLRVRQHAEFDGDVCRNFFTSEMRTTKQITFKIGNFVIIDTYFKHGNFILRHIYISNTQITICSKLSGYRFYLYFDSKLNANFPSNLIGYSSTFGNRSISFPFIQNMQGLIMFNFTCQMVHSSCGTSGCSLCHEKVHSFARG